jgi:hypothetical protein
MALQFGLQVRGCPLRGIQATPDLAAHMQRFTGNGWQRAEARDMSAVYRGCLDPGEKRRWVGLSCMLSWTAQVQPLQRAGG